MNSRTFKTADLCDEFPDKVRVCEPMFLSFGKKRRFSGPMATVKVHEDNVLVREALETLPPGTILVVDGGGSTRCALLGGKLARIAVERGLSGVIINGCVRDSPELSEMEIGILALASHPLRSKKEGEGEKGVALEFGGIAWMTGHYIHVDEDGVVVSAEDLQKERS